MLTGSLAGKVSWTPSSSFSSVVGFGGSLTSSTASLALVVDPPVGCGLRFFRMREVTQSSCRKGLVDLQTHRADYVAPCFYLGGHVLPELRRRHRAGLGRARCENLAHLGVRVRFSDLGGQLLYDFSRRLGRGEERRVEAHVEAG